MNDKISPDLKYIVRSATGLFFVLMAFYLVVTGLAVPEWLLTLILIVYGGDRVLDGFLTVRHNRVIRRVIE